MTLILAWIESLHQTRHDTFDIVEYAVAAGCDGYPDGWIKAGLRGSRGDYHRPGTYLTDSEIEEPDSIPALKAKHDAAVAQVQSLVDETNELRPPG